MVSGVMSWIFFFSLGFVIPASSRMIRHTSIKLDEARVRLLYTTVLSDCTSVPVLVQYSTRTYSSLVFAFSGVPLFSTFTSIFMDSRGLFFSVLGTKALSARTFFREGTIAAAIRLLRCSPMMDEELKA